MKFYVLEMHCKCNIKCFHEIVPYQLMIVLMKIILHFLAVNCKKKIKKLNLLDLNQWKKKPEAIITCKLLSISWYFHLKNTFSCLTKAVFIHHICLVSSQALYDCLPTRTADDQVLVPAVNSHQYFLPPKARPRFRDLLSLPISS